MRLSNKHSGLLQLAARFVLIVAILFVDSRESVAQLSALGRPPDVAQAAMHASKLFEQNRTQWQSLPQDPAAAWNFGRACYAWAEFAPNARQRATVARAGIEACRRAIQINPSLGVAHYYLAMDLGQLAQTRTLGALVLVREMEAEFKKAIELDATVDHAGPYRCLGQLYRDAPGSPISIGNRSRARECLSKAVELCPDYPGNQLLLIEALLRWGETDAAVARMNGVEQSLARAGERLKSVEWTLSLADWAERWENVKKKLAPNARSRS